MQTSWQLRMLLAFLALGVALYFVFPSLVYFSLDEKAIREVRQSKSAFLKFLPSWSPKSHIVPGLDLQGGIHIVLGVDLDKAITDKTARASDRLVEYAKKEGLTIASLRQHGESLQLQDRIEVSLLSSADVATF